MCEGTFSSDGDEISTSGLSPRVRGNPARPEPGRARRRSIPACAGEPQQPGYPNPMPEVYPRVCGGTFTAHQFNYVIKGLSPRVRGNRTTTTVERNCVRSIPACAGEPRWRPAMGTRRRVYPRVCGGTWAGHQTSTIASGLSPRVRGNRVHQRGGRPL